MRVAAVQAAGGVGASATVASIGPPTDKGGYYTQSADLFRSGSGLDRVKCPVGIMLVRKLLLVVLALVVSGLPAAAADPQKVQVVPLSRDGEVLVSFKL